jgi:hypothetical protein
MPANCYKLIIAIAREKVHIRASDFQVVPLLAGFVPAIRFPVSQSLPFTTPLS